MILPTRRQWKFDSNTLWPVNKIDKRASKRVLMYVMHHSLSLPLTHCTHYSTLVCNLSQNHKTKFIFLSLIEKLLLYIIFSLLLFSSSHWTWIEFDVYRLYWMLTKLQAMRAVKTKRIETISFCLDFVENEVKWFAKNGEWERTKERKNSLEKNIFACALSFSSHSCSSIVLVDRLSRRKYFIQLTDTFCGLIAIEFFTSIRICVLYNRRRECVWLYACLYWTCIHAM